MAYKEINMYVDPSMYKYKCPKLMIPIGVCVHNTYNKASARNEVQNMRKESNKKKVSFHDAVDDIEVVHGIPYTRNAFHAGDGGKGPGNLYYISVEICYSKYGGEKFDKAETNAAAHIAKLLKKYDWDISHVKKHQDFSGKYCPHRTLDKGWQRFLNMVQAELDKLDGKKTSAKKENNKLVVDGKWKKATTGYTQKVYGTTVDYIISRQPKANKEYLPNCYTDSWKFTTVYKGGSELIKAIQKDMKAKGHYKGTVDGYFGKKSIIAVQNFLKYERKLYTGRIDGVFGPASVKAWQKFINSKL